MGRSFQPSRHLSDVFSWKKAWHLISSFYALLSQKVNSEEKCYPGLILASNEMVANAEETKGEEWVDFLRA